MFTRNSLVTRIAVGKMVGLLAGLIGFLMMPHVLPDAGEALRWGFLLWYVTLGAVIAVYGVFDFHPVLRIPLPWWVRSPLIGAWFNFVLTLLMYDTLASFSLALFGSGGVFVSPFWFVAEGALIGAVIGYLATRIGGEGPGIAGR